MKSSCKFVSVLFVFSLSLNCAFAEKAILRDPIVQVPAEEELGCECRVVCSDGWDVTFQAGGGGYGYTHKECLELGQDVCIPAHGTLNSATLGNIHCSK